MPEPNRSKRFQPGTVMDRVVPIVLVLLALALLAVIVIILLSLT